MASTVLLVLSLGLLVVAFAFDTAWTTKVVPALVAISALLNLVGIRWFPRQSRASGR